MPFQFAARIGIPQLVSLLSRALSSNIIDPEISSRCLEQFQHFPVEFVAAEVVIGHIPAAAVEDAEVAAQIPQSPTPARFLP